MNGTQFLKGLAIIAIGVILLLNNLKILDWSVWNNIVKLWPLLLVSLGISLIFRRRLSWLAPLVILIGILIGAGANYMGIDLNMEGKMVTEVETLQQEMTMMPEIPETAQEAMEEVDVSVEEEIITGSTAETLAEEQELTEVVLPEEMKMIPQIQRANLRLSYDVGTFLLEFPTPLVYQCQVSYRYPAFKPVEDYSVSGHWANIYIHHNTASSDQQLRNPGNKIELKLNKDIIYNLLIETGATSIDYDLSKFKVEQCTVKSGASDIKIIAPQYNADINIDSGVSKIDIGIPGNVGVKVMMDTGLSMKDLDENFQEQEKDIFISKNYYHAEYQVNINIDSGLSQISIHYM